MQVSFKRQIFLPQDHGSWVFILSPLLVGIFASQSFTRSTFFLILTSMAAFLIRQPVAIITKVQAGRRSREDLPPARFWALVYGAIIGLGLLALIPGGFVYIAYLAIPGILVFAWHLWLVGRRAERRQAGVEIIATGVLSLAAPAAYWVGLDQYSPVGWWLWCLTWLQSSASIVYAYLRLEQRGLEKAHTGIAAWKMGWRAILYTSFNLATSIALGVLGLLPSFVFLPFLLQWGETLWGITHPAIGWKPTRIGIRQLIVSSLWTILFILFWIEG